MTRFATLCAALLLTAPAAAQDQLQPVGGSVIEEPAPALVSPRADPEDFGLAKKKIVDCEGEKFVFAWGAGARPTKVTLCSKKDATPEELVKMLDDAASKLEQAAMAEDRRTAIVQQIRAKIAELKRAPAAAAPAPVQNPGVTVPNSALASNDARAVVPPTEYAALPPIAPVASKSPVPAAALTPPSKPRLSFECYTPGEISAGGPCTILERDMRLTVKAGEALPGVTRLRFMRRGENRGEIALAQLRKGQSVRLALPRALCAGVVNSQAKIQVIRGGEMVESIGPYLLRC